MIGQNLNSNMEIGENSEGKSLLNHISLFKESVCFLISEVNSLTAILPALPIEILSSKRVVLDLTILSIQLLRYFSTL